MTDKRFRCVFKEHENKNSWSMIKDNQLDKPLYIKDVVDLLNAFHEENEKLRKQIQNYEKLIANSYVGEEETLDGFVGKYVIFEDELQKYKNKNEMIGDG